MSYDTNNSYFEWLFKYLWIVLILPKPGQFVVLTCYTLFLLWKNRTVIKLDKFGICIFGYIIIYIISIIINAPYVDSPVRIMAAINSAGIWMISLLLYSLYSSQNFNIKAIKKYSFINDIILFVLFLIFRILVIMGVESARMPVLGHWLFMVEEIGFKNLRFIGLLDYPTLVAVFVLLLMPFSVTYIFELMIGEKNIYAIFLAYLFYIIMFLPVYYCYSRVGYLLYLVGFFAMIMITMNDQLTKSAFWIIAISMLIVILCSGIVFRDQIMEIITKIWNLRQGSNYSRKIIYKESIDGWLTSPIVGKGIKIIGETGFPIGSHSTYLGVLYKTGILGAAFVLIGLIAKIKDAAFRIKKADMYDKMNMSFLIIVLLFLIFEDLDGANWLICVFFSILGIIDNKS